MEKWLQTSDIGLPDGAAAQLKSEFLALREKLYEMVAKTLSSPQAA